MFNFYPNSTSRSQTSDTHHVVSFPSYPSANEVFRWKQIRRHQRQTDLPQQRLSQCLNVSPFNSRRSLGVRTFANVPRHANPPIDYYITVTGSTGHRETGGQTYNFECSANETGTAGGGWRRGEMGEPIREKWPIGTNCRRPIRMNDERSQHRDVSCRSYLLDRNASADRSICR